MKLATRSRLGWLPFLVLGVVMSAAAALLVFMVMDPLIPCGDEFCFNRLVILPISAIGAGIVALALAAYARLGARGYVAALATGVVGFVVALEIISGGRLRP